MVEGGAGSCEVERWEWIAVHCAVHLKKRSNIPFEDLVQEGRLALWDGLKTYDPNRGTKLSTWLHHKVKWRLGELNRGDLGRDKPKPKTLYYGEEYHGGSICPRPTPEEVVMQSDLQRQVERIIPELTPDQQLVTRSILSGERVVDFCERSGMNKHNAFYHRRTVLKKLRERVTL